MTIKFSELASAVLTDCTIPSAFYFDDVVTTLVDFRPNNFYIRNAQWQHDRVFWFDTHFRFHLSL